MKKIHAAIYEHIIQPIMTSVAPVRQVSWGTAMGVFIGLTPTMGIQMYLIAAMWVLCRYLLRFHFNLPVGLAVVWVNNPLTVVPLYYLFLITGDFVLNSSGWVAGTVLTYQHFQETFMNIAQRESTWEAMVEGTRFLLIDLGWPMLIGGLCYAIPGALVAFFVTEHWLTQYRQRKAAQENMTYAEWRLRYETVPTK